MIICLMIWIRTGVKRQLSANENRPMATELTVVIAYDISRARTRRRVVKLLQAQLARVQYSVFEGRLSHEAADRLYDAAERAIDDSDSLRMYLITATGLEKCRATGGTPLPDQGHYWLA